MKQSLFVSLMLQMLVCSCDIAFDQDDSFWNSGDSQGDDSVDTYNVGVEDSRADSEGMKDVGESDTGMDSSGWTGSFDPGFSVDIEATGSSRIGEIQVAGNEALIRVDGRETRGVVTERIVWNTSDGEYRLFQVLSPEADDLFVGYVYCLGSSVTYIYYESYLIDMSGEGASGTCSDTAQNSTIQANLEVITALPEPEGRLADVSLYSDSINVVNGSGSIVVDSEYSIDMFGFVDCLDCPSADGRGWYEFHSIIHKNFPEIVCFGIVYLFPDNGEGRTAWGFCLSHLAKMPVADLGLMEFSL